MTAATLTSAELMERDGFVTFDDVVPPHLLKLLSDGVDDLIEQSRALRKSTYEFQLEAPGPGGGWAARAADREGIPGKLRVVGQAHNHAPKIAEVERELRLQERLVLPTFGKTGYLHNVFLWAKPGEVGSHKPWHQDMLFVPPDFDPETMQACTIWIAVDDSHEGNGCLQFLPGSHRERKVYQPEGRSDNLFDTPTEPALDIAKHWPDLTPRVVPRRPGSAVMFTGYTAHMSTRNESTEDRRAVSFAYRLPR
jgi:2-oxoglutarate-dependent dioxygenase